MDMYELLGKKSPQVIQKELGERFKKIRKSKHITQQELSKRSLVSYGSIKLFEQTGKISLTALLFLCDALDILNEFEKLFKSIHKSWEEVTNENS